jgi:hypothetical protein
MVNNIVLHMGFVNTPYTKQTIMRPATSAKLEAKRQHRRGFSKTMTADRVARILEGKYNIVEVFQEIHKEDIHNIINEGIGDVAFSMLSENRPFTFSKMKNLMKSNTKQIELMFRQFLNFEEMNGMIPGVPTKAALKGVRHGRGRVTRRGIPRPSFVDTGIYRASFRCWATK